MTPTLELDLREPTRLDAALTQHLPAGGVFVEISPPPALFQAVDVAIRLPDESFRMLKGQVVNQAPGGVFVLLTDATAVASLVDQASALRTETASARSEDTQEVEEGSEEVEASSEALDDAPSTPEEEPPEAPRTGPLTGGSARPAWELLDNSSDVPLHKQVASLTVNDKIRLARQANRPVRRILIRDMEKRIHLEVIKNPQLKDDEAIEYAGTAGISPVALEWLSSQARYSKNKKMVMTLITNPMTPPRVARKLLDKLTNRELLKVMRSPRTREAINRECKKRLMKAGII